ncbi:hypothetical protein DFQ10_105278 [Winogradskyella eximia]|uniref:Uncharacterized protein n=1 Tax=Winogradskyella eximia TaxID=262006 RepID=A0A3D9H2E7_9FLAO|nr:DUF6090 family protein [Winogradskyella eximia]RED43678.1 hypothetical protein DFQ10_105278 [Winogradskyella eximia]
MVVIGILIALSLNNWNESRKNEIIKQQLIEDLIVELQSSRVILNDAIALGDSLIADGQLYLKHIGSKELTIEIDSLKKLGDFITYGIPYDLNLPIYEDSKSSGRLSMINNKKVLLLYAEIMSADIGGSIHRKISNDMYYNGSDWELRKEIGLSEILSTSNEMIPERFRLTEKEFLEILARPSTFATLNNSLQMKVVRINYMNRISNGMTEVIGLLEEEKK